MLGRKRLREETKDEVIITDEDASDGDQDEEHQHPDHEDDMDAEEEEDHPPRHLFQQLFTWQSQVGNVATPQGSNLEPSVPDFIFTFENCTLVENFHPFSAGNHIPIIQVNLWTSQITLAVTGSEMYTYDLVMGAIPNEPLDNLDEDEEEEVEKDDDEVKKDS
jgi:hypothetical protein